MRKRSRYAVKLRQWRGKRTLSHAAISLGISRSYLNQLETGERDPSFDLALRIEQKIGIAVDLCPSLRKLTERYLELRQRRSEAA